MKWWYKLKAWWLYTSIPAKTAYDLGEDAGVAWATDCHMSGYKRMYKQAEYCKPPLLWKAAYLRGFNRGISIFDGI